MDIEGNLPSVQKTGSASLRQTTCEWTKCDLCKRANMSCHRLNSNQTKPYRHLPTPVDLVI